MINTRRQMQAVRAIAGDSSHNVAGISDRHTADMAPVLHAHHQLQHMCV